MKKIKKKIALKFINSTIIFSPIVATISCLSQGEKSFREENRDYDIGYSSHVVTSLNYLKYSSAVSIGHALVESLKKGSPKYQSDLYYALNVPRFYIGTNAGYSFWRANEFSLTTGTLKTSSTYPAMETKTIDSKSDTWTFRLNGRNEWSNGDLLKPSNYIDSIVYVLDINTGSQIVDDILKMKIKYSDEFIAAQVSYSKKYKTTYKNPFGYIKNKKYDPKDKNSVYWVQRTTKFPAQIYNKSISQLKNLEIQKIKEYLKKQSEENDFISKIEFYAKNLGIYGDLNSSHPYTHVEGLTREKLKTNVPDEKPRFNDDVSYDGVGGEKIYPNVFQLQKSIKGNAFSDSINGLLHRKWIPINRKFVESIGGIEKFGLSKDRFLSQGAFKLESVSLGRSGSIIMKKNENYWDKDNTIPRKIKIFMQDDPNILSAMFADGYISYAKINAIQTKALYAKNENRDLLKKASGFGTTALVFNVDKKSKDYLPILDDEDLRKAIFYAIKRSNFIRLSGFDTTFPSYAFVDYNGSVDNEWRTNYDSSFRTLQRLGHSLYYDKYAFKTPKKMYPYKYDVTVVLGSSIMGNLQRDDHFYNLQLARKYFANFQKKHPGNHEIVYSHNSQKSNLNIGIALQSAIQKAFQGKLKIKIKGYAPTVYDVFLQTGRFQITYRNLDYLMSNIASGIDAFLAEDGIKKEEEKSTGFLKNPTGGWTFLKTLKNYSNKLSLMEAEIKNRLEISDVIWDKLKELSTIPEEIKSKNIEYANVFVAKRNIAFFKKAAFEFDGEKYEVDPNFQVSYQIMNLVDAANKILMDQSPIIPLFVVDNTISISRMVNTSLGYMLWNFDYGYDYKYKPRGNLPGKEAI